ncbi:glycoside hydrolase family 23 protein [Lactarius akahatsu]|uniref:Glycoside hydrolase family 23 protein n=1 Tax=Lactarius akahatsu TaxID=416441 RepID=A0AAD4LNW4_9AGAM|nr:glycoside hydrolase family 23 protein [Lactarius akahatsu]
MKFSIGLATFTILLATAIVEATWLDAAAHKRHAAHVNNARDVAHRAGKRCKPRPPGQSSSVHHANPTPTHPADNSPPNVPTKDSAPKASSEKPPVQTPASEPSGLIRVGSGQCGSPGASKKVTKLSGPNGNIDWINCGITGGGWTPPHVEIKQLVTVTLASARHTAFAPCHDNIIATFEKYGNIHGIPSILLASFAMQESSCNPSAVGGAGEQGLMQITREKCKGAPGGNCQDIDFNIRTGAEFFATLLAVNNGDIFTTIGKYNGWHHGMTYSDATSAANTHCCSCQNNLDYVHQFVNGWLQGMDAYDAGLGKYFNLERCHQ